MSADTYFIAWKGRRDGPYSLEQLAELLQNGEIGLLHRVETSAGLIALRQLLLAADPIRWGYLAQAPGGAPPSHTSASYQPLTSNQLDSSTPTSAPTPPSVSNPFGLVRPSYSPEPEIQTPKPAPPPASSQLETRNSKLETSSSAADSPEVLRAYIVAGLTFLFPPLAGYAYLLTQQLADQGHAQLARLLHYLYAALALTGLLFWILIWKMW